MKFVWSWRATCIRPRQIVLEYCCDMRTNSFRLIRTLVKTGSIQNLNMRASKGKVLISNTHCWTSCAILTAYFNIVERLVVLVCLFIALFLMAFCAMTTAWKRKCLVWKLELLSGLVDVKLDVVALNVMHVVLCWIRNCMECEVQCVWCSVGDCQFCVEILIYVRAANFKLR